MNRGGPCGALGAPAGTALCEERDRPGVIQMNDARTAILCEHSTRREFMKDSSFKQELEGFT